MSFDANIGRAAPIIKAATSMNNDGGSGGNTGYMMSGRNKNKNQQNRESLFSNNKKTFDFFETESEEKKLEAALNKNSWVENLLNKFIK